jgi:epoxyqueuosine reductase
LQQKIHFISTIVANTAFIKEYSKTLGFTYCGIAKAERLDEEARHLEAWLNKGFHGKMSYMERNFDLRIDPTLLVPGAKSVVTLMLNYFPDEQQVEGSPKISKYAYGKDYHDVIREKLSQLLQAVNAKIGAVQGRGFVDSAPVLERAWAKRSGLGWVGKNANLISKQSGSFFFLATLIIDLPLIYDDPFAKDYCGTCTKCLDACPTDAIIAPAIVDGSKCISYLTIELKDELISPQFADKMEGWMFGCDICQDVCPWNRFSRPHQEPQLQPIPEVLNMSTGAWEALLEDDFKTILKLSPIKRSKWKGIQRNLKFLNKN